MWDNERRNEWNRPYFRERYHDFRQRVLDHLGAACVICAATEDLMIHHKEPQEKEFNISQQWGRPWPATLRELEKCELRCRKHHATAHYGEPEHGTVSCYKRNRCRCEACVKANTAEQRVYKATYFAKLKKLGVKTLGQQHDGRAPDYGSGA